jgi:hypothetical protein
MWWSRTFCKAGFLGRIIASDFVASAYDRHFRLAVADFLRAAKSLEKNAHLRG